MSLDKEGIEHYKWAVERAFEYIERDEYKNAFLSFESDMKKNDQTSELVNGGLIGIVKLGTMMNLTKETVIRYITGFPYFKNKWIQ